MSDYDNDKESSYLSYWDINNLHGWEMSPKHLTFMFEWVEDTSKFTRDFIKNYDKNMK